MSDFKHSKAVRSEVPLLIGLTGPSGSGKTKSALRLASGIQRVAGGEVFFIDTEARRALHYADDHNFQHVEFDAPFGPLRYLAAIDHCISSGATTIIVDSMSHEHEGPGGVLEMHEAELDRIAGNDWKKRERVKFLAWQKPKKDRRRLINSLLQRQCNFVFCFRAKEKMKMQSGRDERGKAKPPLQLGWMPIGADEYAYEMTLHAILPPGAEGVPQWRPEAKGEQLITKLPDQFKELVGNGQPFDESMGEAMARWARGDQRTQQGSVPLPPIDDELPEYTSQRVEVAELLASLKRKRSLGGLDSWTEDNAIALAGLSPDERRQVVDAYRDRRTAVRQADEAAAAEQALGGAS